MDNPKYEIPEDLKAAWDVLPQNCWERQLIQRMAELLSENLCLKAESTTAHALYSQCLEEKSNLLIDNLRMDRRANSALDEHASMRRYAEKSDAIREDQEKLIAHLSAPVSDEEWSKSHWQEDGGMRSFVNAFLAARQSAKEPQS